MKNSVETGSFRDRRARVYHVNGEIIRCLDKIAYENWIRFSNTKLYRRLQADGKIVGTEEVPTDKLSKKIAMDRWAGALRHESIPFISYPYEWSFDQLKDAALFHLNLMKAALEEGFVLKDSSAYNIQWRGSKPVFIDIPSFEPLAPGEPWVGYLQFCEMFLNPLLLSAHKGIRFQPWMRGRIDGIETQQLANLLSFRDLFRKGIFTHIYLHSKLQKSSQSRGVTKEALRKEGFSKEMILSNVRSLERIIERLELGSDKSHWVDYAQTHSYREDDYQAKKTFVKKVISERNWRLIWDLGCNTGDFSRIAANSGSYVVALDADDLAVNALFNHSKTENDKRILPLIMNLVDPSTALGWRGQERQSLENRNRPDLVLALALIHHLVIGANVLLSDFVGWLAGLKASLIIEFISKQDEMVSILLQNKEDLYTDYSKENLESCLNNVFDIQWKISLKEGLRTLYYAIPKK